MTLKDMLSVLCWEVCLVIAFIVFLVLGCFWLTAPNSREQLWQSPGYLIAVGLMSAWTLRQIVYFVSGIVRGLRQKKEGEKI